MASKALPAPELVRQVLEYNPATGKLYWLPRDNTWFASDARLTADQKCNAWNARNAGREAFTAFDGKGYFQGQVLKYHTTAHRVACVIANGQWPTIVDHIDGDGRNNRLENLRIVTKEENSRNVAMPSTNSSGAVGVRLHSKTRRWEAHIGSGKTYKFLGSFGCRTAAQFARKTEEKLRGYHPNHGSRSAVFVRQRRGLV